MFGTGGKIFLWIIRATSFSLPLMARGHQFSDNRIYGTSAIASLPSPYPFNFGRVER